MKIQQATTSLPAKNQPIEGYEDNNNINIMMFLFGRERQKPVLQRQSSDESYSSTSSSSKKHRRTPSFNGRSSIGSEVSGSDVRGKSSTSKTTDPLRVPWSASGSGALAQVYVMDCSPESKIGRKILGGYGEADEHCLRELELIRQLSFSPPRKTKKRTDTAGTETSSSSETVDTHHKHESSPIGLDLKHLQALRRASPSPLVGLQYLPDGNMFI